MYDDQSELQRAATPPLVAGRENCNRLQFSPHHDHIFVSGNDEKPAPCPKPSKHAQQETHTDYCRVIVCAQRFRLIVCNEGIQWKIQRRAAAAGKSSAGKWKTISWHRKRDALIRCWNSLTGLPTPDVIKGFPQQFSRFMWPMKNRLTGEQSQADQA